MPFPIFRNPSDWVIVDAGAGNINATNVRTGETFSGTIAAFNTLIQGFSEKLASAPATFVLEQSVKTFLMPSSGTSNATGEITFATAPAILEGTGNPVSVFLPAGVVTAGSQGTGAKVYEAVTVGNNAKVQLIGTGIVTANAAYTQVLTLNRLGDIPIPGFTLKDRGSVRVTAQVYGNASASAKTISFKFTGTTGTGALTMEIGRCGLYKK